MIPTISQYMPPVSQFLPLVSSVPPETLSRKFGVRPAWPGYRALSRRPTTAPVEKGFLQFLTWLLALPAIWPYMPANGLSWIAESIEQQAAEEWDEEKRLEEERLSLMMSGEMGEITEEEYQSRLAEIERKIEAIKGPSR